MKTKKKEKLMFKVKKQTIDLIKNYDPLKLREELYE